MQMQNKINMNVNRYKTLSAKPADVQRVWHVIDVDQVVVGRLASKVAQLLKGKHRADYTPHVDMGDFVVIINADKVRLTGRKEEVKEYFRHTGYPGGVKVIKAKDARWKKPTLIVENAVKGMLPKTKLGRQMFKRLKVYAGPDHPHEAQQPQVLEL
jgi:large subunit ribosomal protein L13